MINKLSRRDRKLKKEKPKELSYIIEREFLSKITVTELINHIIQSHIKDNKGNGAIPS